MALSGEQNNQEYLAFKAKKKVDKRQLKNDDAGKAFLVELGSTLHKAKENRDKKEQREQAEKERKQTAQVAAKERKQEEARIKKEGREQKQRERLRNVTDPVPPDLSLGSRVD
jgi:cobalamin-dependent methionine synthase I